MEPRLEKIFEAWFDYDHSSNEEQKLYNKDQRARLIQEAVLHYKAEQYKKPAPQPQPQTYVSVGDFLHMYRDQYRAWAIRKNLASPRKRF